MDFQGQKLAERIYQYLIIICGIIGWIIGFIKQDFTYTFYFVAGGTGLACLLCLPDWPYLNRNPLNWQKPEVKDK
ncbi:signal peptidase complex subunit 1 [Tieghemostelium lacteum]|uniref:Signal peptidase complex subunit 1 n=1 Tax=Tieghemostelium lacteum TaxID=361077 RepID=A0A151Z501_TIELA|nr:signal peptidase complex subunit 1 [Tieghemostelium lacteum]|eukprot:KYQ89021.1 signal peptidase complex subunit 1 [Tieghemostelium lacteum]